MRRFACAYLALAAALMAGSAHADEEATGPVSVAFDGGFLGDYAHEPDIWESGTMAGVSCFYSLGPTWSIGGRIGIDHWSYSDRAILEDLAHEGGELLGGQSTGRLQIVEFGPAVRATRDRALAGRIGLFAQLCANAAYIDAFALTEVLYDIGTVGTFEINESRLRGDIAIAFGLTHHLSDSSWLELIPSYRAVFDDDATKHLAGISLSYRVVI